ncbi:MAG: hypothetical protein AB8B69_27545 [Chitinophagales bacterium]
MTEHQIEKEWYDHTWVVALSCFFFLPLGLYALWKNRFISKSWKQGVTVLAVLLAINSAFNASQQTPYVQPAGSSFDDQIINDVEHNMGTGICENIPEGSLISNVKVGEITPIGDSGLIDVSVEFDYFIKTEKNHHKGALLYSLIDNNRKLESIGGCDYGEE